MGSALSKSLNQMGDPRFRRIIFLGLAFALVVFIGLFVGLMWFVTHVPETGVGWLDDNMDWIAGLGGVMGFLLVSYVLFPAVVTTFFGVFLDDIVDAVEDRHYPHARAPRQSSIGEGILLSLKMGLVVVAVNLIALPIYLLLLFTGVGAFLVFILINAWLLGREYFELVAVRHFPPAQAEAVRKRYSSKAFMGGAVIAVFFAIPVVNLLAPIIGAAMMTHLFHDIRPAGTEPA